MHSLFPNQVKMYRTWRSSKRLFLLTQRLLWLHQQLPLWTAHLSCQNLRFLEAQAQHRVTRRLYMWSIKATHCRQLLKCLAFRSIRSFGQTILKAIKFGDKLVILPVSGVEYTVKSGDTLQKVATKYKGDLDTIAEFNNLSDNSKLTVGDVIIIPDGQLSASESGPVIRQSSGSASGSNGTVHVGPGGTSPWASGAMPPPGSAPAIGTRGSESPTIIGYFERPILGGVKTQGIHGHNAVDLSAPVGTPIMAAAGGEVIVAKSGGWDGGYGSYIEIQHPNGTQTLYAHLSHVLVSVGETVAQGQVIGKLGDTGDSTGPHVHFEIHGAQNPF